MHRGIKSYVLRAGRVSTRQQQGLDSCLKQYELTLGDKAWDLEKVFGRKADTIVEIGFGMGASLLEMAINNPQLNYLGIEVHRAGIGGLAFAVQEHQLTNVRIAPYDAVEVFSTQIEQNAVAGIQIFFPDPWHKKRHHKRRLIQTDFVQLLVDKLRPGGFIHCATDWQDYAEHMLATLSANPKLHNQVDGGGYATRPESRPLTKFEKRGERLGHGVWDLIFIKMP